MTDLTSLTQLLKNKEAPDVTPPFSLANLGSLIFLNSDATADIVLPMIVVASVSTVVCAGTLQCTCCWLNGLPGLLTKGFPGWPVIGLSSSESKRLACTGWRGVLVKWTCLRGGIGGASSFLLHRIVSSWRFTAPPLFVLTVPGMKSKAVLFNSWILSPASTSAFCWVR